MGVAISGLVAASVFNNADVFEIEQGGISKKLTKTQLRSLMFSDPLLVSILPQPGDVLSYSGSDFIPGAVPKWRTIPFAAYTEAGPASSSTITFLGGGPISGIKLKGGDYFYVGAPVRTEIGVGVFHYGICTAVTDTLLTVSGAILPIEAIISLAVGTQELVRAIDVQFSDVTYNTHISDPLAKGCLYRWRGATGHLVAFSCSHMNTSNTVKINLQMNGGSNVSTAGVVQAAGTATTHGPFVDNALGDLIRPNCIIVDKQTITVKTPIITGLADYLIVSMTFIVP